MSDPGMSDPGMSDPGMMASGNEMGEVAPVPNATYDPVAFKDVARGRILLAFSALNLGAKSGISGALNSMGNVASGAYNSMGNAFSSLGNRFRGRGGQGQNSLAAARGAAYRAAMEEILATQTDESLGNYSVTTNLVMGRGFVSAKNSGTFSGGRRRRGKNRKTRKSRR
jgi:hypothetical protein